MRLYAYGIAGKAGYAHLRTSHQPHQACAFRQVPKSAVPNEALCVFSHTNIYLKRQNQTEQ